MSTTYTLKPEAIQNGATVSLDTATAFTDGAGGSPVYDQFGDSTVANSFDFSAASHGNSQVNYVITWGDDMNTQADTVDSINLDDPGVTLTQVNGGNLYLNGSLSINRGTLDLGDSGQVGLTQDVTFATNATFTLNGVLQGSGSFFQGGGPELVGNGTIIAISHWDSGIGSGNTTLTVGNSIAAGITAEVGAGADLDFGGAVAAGVTVTLDDGLRGAVSIDDLQDFHGTISGLVVNTGSVSAGAYIDLTTIHPSDIVSTSIVGHQIIINGASSVLGTIDLADSFDGKFANWTGDLAANGTDLYIADSVCFVAGTRILTPQGEIAVETITAGDEVVVVLDGERVSRPVKWVGYRRLELGRRKDAAALSPIRFVRGSLGEDLPKRDLLVSPPHCMFIDDKLIPAKLLVNNMTIYRDTARDCVEYYHIELERHAVIIAEGVETESYLDTGNRSFFSNAGMALMLHPEFHVNAGLRCWETDACAPLAVSPACVRPVWDSIAARAEELGYQRPRLQTTNDPDIHITADGRRIDPVAVSSDNYTFVIPAGVSAAYLASRSVVPGEVTQYMDDPREIGVAVRKLSVRSPAGTDFYSADHPAFNEGWHAPERDQGAIWRWSKGQGKLPITNTAGPVVVVVTICETTTYLMDGPRPVYRQAA